MPFSRAAHSSLALSLAFFVAGCSGLPPQILTIAEKTVAVNQTLEFDVAVLDEDSKEVSLSMLGAPKGAALNQIEGKLAKFSWTPNPAQTGVHTITFVANDGHGEDTETVNVKVTGGQVLRLVSPSRYTVDLATTATVKFMLELEASSSGLDYEMLPDVHDEWGADVQFSGRRLLFNWTPTQQQRERSQHSFLLRVSDDAGQVLQETITIVFRGVSNDSCSEDMALPVVLVDPIAAQTGESDIELLALIEDEDSEIQYAAVFWATVEDPENGDWNELPLDAEGGGLFTGVIPALDLRAGESATVTWQVCAQDDDDASGESCDNWGCSDFATFMVSAALNICEPCNRGQCGASGMCITGYGGESFCGASCEGGCPSGYICSTVTSLEGTGQQCVPSGCRNGLSDPNCSCAGGRVKVPAAGELVINEVLYDPPDACPETKPQCESSEKLTVDVNGDGVRQRDEGQEEFVEILNVSGEPLDLTGVTIADDDRVRFTFPSFVLPAGRAALVFGGGDPAAFSTLGGAYKFSAKTSGTTGGLLLNNTGDTLTLALGSIRIDTVSWGSTTARGVSMVREKEGDNEAKFVAHGSASGASGARWSPGTHTCSTPFPLDVQACAPPACNITNRDAEPQSDARSTAPCLRPLPQIITSTLALKTATPDPRDIYVIEGRAGDWLHVRTGDGPGMTLEDTTLKLYARSGLLLAENDDDPWTFWNYHSRIVHKLPSDGVYYIEVSAFVFGSTPVSGSYSLTVETSSNEPVAP